MNQEHVNEYKRAVIYCRVSTDEQAAKGYSLPTQIEACERYAHLNGFKVIGTFMDDYTGTVPIEQRPEGRKAYDMLHSNQADVLIAYRIDRIVRPPEDGDEWEMPLLIRGLAKLGKEIHTVNRGQLKTDFASLLIAMLDARKAGEERRDIVERTMRGRKRKAQEGKIIGSGPAPYGYKHGKGVLIVNAQEAAIVRMIYRWYTVGDGDGRPMTDYEITRKLSTMGIPTPGETRPVGKTRLREPGKWCYPTVRRILISETYAGKLRFGRVGSYHKGSKRSIHSKEEQFVFDVPSIIDRNTWEAAQARRERNKNMSPRNCRREYLLRGLITCGCGRKMAGKSHEPLRYVCSVYKTFIRGVENDQVNCREKSVNGNVLESVVWNYVLDLLSDPERFEAEWRKAAQAEHDNLAPKRERLDVIGDLIQHCEQEAEETAAALKKATGLVLTKLEADMRAIDDRYAKLTAERDRLLVELQRAPRFDDEALKRALQFRADILEGLKDPTFEEKRLYLELLKVNVLVKDGRATIRCALPTDPVEFDLGKGAFDIRTFSCTIPPRYLSWRNTLG
jgi:site-specific DNA recombinase